MAVEIVISPAEVVRKLNEFLSADPRAMKALVLNRVPAAEDLAGHPAVQATPDGLVGFLGILNGLFGAFDGGPCAGLGPITVVFDLPAGNPLGDILRFVETDRMDPTRTDVAGA